MLFPREGRIGSAGITLNAGRYDVLYYFVKYVRSYVFLLSDINITALSCLTVTVVQSAAVRPVETKRDERRGRGSHHPAGELERLERLWTGCEGHDWARYKYCGLAATRYSQSSEAQ